MLERLGRALGLIAGLAALTYLVGAAALGLRLAFAEFPARMIVGQLPREFAITVGLSEIVLPAVVLATAATVFAWVTKLDRHNGKYPWIAYFTTPAFCLALWAGALAISTVDGLDPELLWLIPACLILVLLVVLAMELRAPINTIDRRGKRLAALGAVTAVPAAAGAMMIAGAAPMESVRVCAAKGAYVVDGKLIGYSTDQVVVGVGEGDEPHAVVMPMAKVEQVFIGHGSTAQCQTTPAADADAEKDS